MPPLILHLFYPREHDCNTLHSVFGIFVSNHRHFVKHFDVLILEKSFMTTRAFKRTGGHKNLIVNDKLWINHLKTELPKVL